MVNCPCHDTQPAARRASAARPERRGRTARARGSDEHRDRAGVRPGQWARRAEPKRAARRPAGPRQRRSPSSRALWLAYTAWSAGRALAAQPLSSPQIAQWVAVAAGPLALLGLVVADVRPHPAQGSRALHPLGGRDAHRSALARSAARSAVAADHRQPGRADGDRPATDAAWRRRDRQARRHYPRIRFEHASGWRVTARRSTARPKPRATTSPSCSTICRGPSRQRACVAEQLRAIGSEFAHETAEFGQQVGDLAERTRRSRPDHCREATDRLAARLAEIDSAGTGGREQVGEARSRLLRRARRPARADLGDARQTSARASTPRPPRSRRWSSRPRPESASRRRSLPRRSALNVDHANGSLDDLSSSVAEQERASQRMIAEIDRGLAHDRRALHRARDQRRRARQPFPRIARPARADRARRARRAGRHRRTARSARSPSGPPRCARASTGWRTKSATRSEPRSAKRRAAPTGWSTSTRRVKPEIGWVRDAAVEAGERMAATGGQIAEQQDRFAALLAAVDDGVGGAQAQLAALAAAIAQAQARSVEPHRRNRRRRWSPRWSRSRKRRPMPPNAPARRSRR